MNKYWLCGLAVLIITGYNCSRNPYIATNKSYKQQVKQYAKTVKAKPAIFVSEAGKPDYLVETVNLNLRKPNFIVLHHTAQNSCAQTLTTFTTTRTQVSAHYVICKDGIVHHMLNDYLRAWHGGAAKWGSVTDVNSSSIGIELDNNGFEPFSTPQLNSLLSLLDTLKRKFNIPAINIIGHADVAPVRKNDPNIFFPWKQLAEKGFGRWYSDTTQVTVPENFNPLTALKIIGYDVKDSSAAMVAFKRHYLADSTAALDEGTKKILWKLMLESLE